MTTKELKGYELRFSKILVNGIRGFIKVIEMMRKPGIVFTEEQKKKIAEFVERDKGEINGI